MAEHEEAQRVVVRDKRRVDPSGAVREPAPDAVAEPVAEERHDEVAAEEFVEVRRLQALVDERTDDLLRVKAEFDNYRKRVERDRLAVAEQATAALLVHLLPVVDDVERAREHGELTGGFKSVADSLDWALAKLGLERFGTAGDPFDPTLHEAVMHQHSAEVTEPTCVTVLRPGYRFAERLLRPAMVAVAEPEAAPVAAPDPAPEPAPDPAPEPAAAADTQDATD
ncbi:MAG TPA: nucleotide exchange factor GrpE [Mycobacteriales bacterium]|jgi:molecular chaperone GrpE|nr:nucleotide exchange factor GrpE [Mycobacteriales bacterium]